MVTWANLHYLDFVLNWVEHVRACGIKAFLVGAMDDRILQVSHSISCGKNTDGTLNGHIPSHGACMRPRDVKMHREQCCLLLSWKRGLLPSTWVLRLRMLFCGCSKVLSRWSAASHCLLTTVHAA